MEDAGKRKRESRDVWQKRIERWKDSGLTADEFASELGINAGTLKFWRYRLSRDSKQSSQALQRRKPNSAPKPKDGSARFIEVTPPTRAATTSAIEVALGDAVVRVCDGFREETLSRVLAVLRGTR
jgi:hypothetical protein